MIIRDVDAFWHRLTGKTNHVETGEIRGDESVLLKGLVPWQLRHNLLRVAYQGSVFG